jgi:hypothetical protein
MYMDNKKKKINMMPKLKQKIIKKKKAIPLLVMSIMYKMNPNKNMFNNMNTLNTQ